MIQGVVITALQEYTDARGWLIETYRDDELPDGFHPAMSYVSITRPNQSRGPHEHKEQADYFCFLGEGWFLVKLWDNRPDSPTYEKTMEFLAGGASPLSVLIPAGVVHAYRNISGNMAMCINYPDALYKGVDKKQKIDEIRYEDTKSKFTI